MKCMTIAALVLATSALAPPLAGQITYTPIAPIRTDEGMIAGKVMQSGVRAWLGVPFAKPPINDLRWKPPQPIAWNGVWTADRKMPECVQYMRPHNLNHYFGEEAQAEDCLYLNVWAPPGSKTTDKLPVIVFLYGGGGTIGSAGSAMYDGENMAKKGVIFVTIGYRLGILGWMALPELSAEQSGHSGNYAYLDQNAGLKWIHENIASFGGDPNLVTISGQSAGAGSVSAQLHSPLSKGFFQRAMMSSTCSIATPGGTTLADAEKQGLEIEKKLGVKDLEHMRYLTADKILSMQAEGQVGTNTPGVRVGAIIDGYFTPGPKVEMAKTHMMSDVPILANFNSGESAHPLQKATTVAEYDDIAYKTYGKEAPAFLKLYPVTSDAEVLPMANKVARENAIANASRNCGVLQAEYNKSPVFISMFNRRHPYVPGVEIADQNPEKVGAYHNGDTVYWFENQDNFNKFRTTRNWTPLDRKLADEMSDSFIAFAKIGNPSTSEVKWPAWTAHEDVFMDFGDKVTLDKFYTPGMMFLSAHPIPGLAIGGGMGAPGIVSGAGPRD